MPATAAPSPGAFQQAFLDARDAGRSGVVCVTHLLGSVRHLPVGLTAAEAVADRIPVRVVDTLSVTGGQGLLALAAADLASSGAALDDVAAALEDMKSRTHVYGVVDSLDYLRRGGRIGGAAKLSGSLLSIKPVIEVRDGVVEVESKQRTRSRSLQYLANKAIEAGPLDRLAATSGVAPDFDDRPRHAAQGAAPSTSSSPASSGPSWAATPGRGRSGCASSPRRADAGPYRLHAPNGAAGLGD